MYKVLLNTSGLCLFFAILLIIMWGKSKKSDAAASKSSKSTESSDIVVSHVAPSSFSKMKSSITPKRVKYAGIIVLLLVIGTVGFILWQNREESKPEVNPEDQTYKITDEEYAKSRVASLLKAKPAANASIEDKRAYHEELISNEYIAGNYQGVVTAYDEAVTVLNENNLDYSVNLIAAKSYIKLNNKSKVEPILSVAEQKVKSAANIDEFQRTELLGAINSIREEINR